MAYDLGYFGPHSVTWRIHADPVQWVAGIRALLLFGTKEQKEKWLPKLMEGEQLAAFALTEALAGSDAANVQTQAQPSEDGSHYILNGEKRYITNASIAQVLTVMARTPNPNDYVLVREVYGDSSGGVAGNNGGSQEMVALVRKPGGTVPALFTVYLRGSTTPWSWASGPVPPSRLAEIDRIVEREDLLGRECDQLAVRPVRVLAYDGATTTAVPEHSTSVTPPITSVAS